MNTQGTSLVYGTLVGNHCAYVMINDRLSKNENKKRVSCKKRLAFSDTCFLFILLYIILKKSLSNESGEIL